MEGESPHPIPLIRNGRGQGRCSAQVAFQLYFPGQLVKCSSTSPWLWSPSTNRSSQERWANSSSTDWYLLAPLSLNYLDPVNTELSAYYDRPTTIYLQISQAPSSTLQVSSYPPFVPGLQEGHLGHGRGGPRRRLPVVLNHPVC